jgi:hypothetical protein
MDDLSFVDGSLAETFADARVINKAGSFLSRWFSKKNK